MDDEIFLVISEDDSSTTERPAWILPQTLVEKRKSTLWGEDPRNLIL